MKHEKKTQNNQSSPSNLRINRVSYITENPERTNVIPFRKITFKLQSFNLKGVIFQFFFLKNFSKPYY